MSLLLEVVNHRINSAGWVCSPNQDTRPDNALLDTIVIHCISLPPGQFGGDEIIALFTNQLDWNAHEYFKTIEGAKVSAHVLIRRDGKLIQFVDFDQRAWHAGVSCFQGRDNCNDFSIGIELEGTEDMPFTNAQYAALVNLTKVLISEYNITHSNIVGHSDIAPGRKTDPGSSFDWDRLLSSL